MRKEYFNLPSNDGKTTLSVIRWIPEGKPIALLQIAHGMVEYIDRYDDFATYCTNQGILVVGHDHLGHGDSVISKESWGYFGEGNMTQVLIDDMYSITKMMKESYLNIPYFVLGHSMGSFITRYYITQYGSDIDGVIICGTGQNPKGTLRSGAILTHIIAQFKGWTYRSPLIDKMAFGGMNKGIQNPRTEQDWLSRNTDIVDAYRAEPRCTFMFTLNGYSNLFKVCLLSQDKNIMSGIPVGLPILIISGEEDPVGANGAAVRKVYEQYRKNNSKDIQMILYPEYRHEILNEIGNECVYEDVKNWILTHL